MKNLLNFLFLFFLLTGCQNKNSTSNIENYEYILTNTIPGSKITILFSKNKITGNSGVNTYNAIYNLNKKTLSVAKESTTKMMGTKELMLQEDEYLKNLRNAKKLKVYNDFIEIETSNGKKLVFKKY